MTADHPIIQALVLGHKVHEHSVDGHEDDLSAVRRPEGSLDYNRIPTSMTCRQPARIYNDVGAVKEKIRNTSPEDAERPVKGARRAFISTLDRIFRANTIETGTQRNEVQLSFVPWQNSFDGI